VRWLRLLILWRLEEEKENSDDVGRLKRKEYEWFRQQKWRWRRRLGRETVGMEKMYWFFFSQQNVLGFTLKNIIKFLLFYL